jgi:hypothetical protein
MTHQEYLNSVGLSNSGMKDLAVSPLRYWWKHIRPEREPEEPTPAQRVGTALHCAVLEPHEFTKRYACGLRQEDYPDALDTIAEMRAFIEKNGRIATGTKKADVAAQVRAINPQQPIWSEMLAAHLKANEGKQILVPDEWRNVGNMASAIIQEDVFQKTMETKGQFEAPLFATYPGMNVPLKAKLDWLAPAEPTVEIKTFIQKYNKSIDESVNAAIWYEGYHNQAYFYSLMRALTNKQELKDAQKQPPHLMFFVESEEPHEVRIRQLRPTTAGEMNMYWEVARRHVFTMVSLYAQCWSEFGENAWKRKQAIDNLIDEDLPNALAFGK